MNVSLRSDLTDWSAIEARIKDLSPVDDGFSLAKRGFITLPEGERIFVKIGVNDDTNKWARKEVTTYRFLEKKGYPFTPRLLAARDDGTGFALEALMSTEGWDWTKSWNNERLTHTLLAMDALADLRPAGRDAGLFADKAIGEADDGWGPLASSPVLQAALLIKLRSSGREQFARTLDFAAMAARSSRFVFDRSVLVHNDIRADNCAWNADIGMVKLVDWNWVQLGDRRIDQGALLVHVHSAGLDVAAACPDRLDAEALVWMAGFWLNLAARPIWPGGRETLRDSQLTAGITAFELAERLL